MADSPMDLNKEEKAAFIVDMFTRIMVHHGMWFAEVRHQMGMEKALSVMDQATKNAVGILMKPPVQDHGNGTG